MCKWLFRAKEAQSEPATATKQAEAAKVSSEEKTSAETTKTNDMKPTKTSQTGIDLIKQYEGLRLTAYKCAAGVWTIGYGHTEGVTGAMIITEETANELLERDLAKFEAGVAELVRVEINQNQFDALVSFAFNVGLANLAKSTLLKKINGLRPVGECQAEFLRWNKAGGKVLAGLTKRRNAEAYLFGL